MFGVLWLLEMEWNVVRLKVTLPQSADWHFQNECYRYAEILATVINTIDPSIELCSFPCMRIIHIGPNVDYVHHFI